MDADTIACPECSRPVPRGRLACPSCGALLASVSGGAGRPGVAPDAEPASTERDVGAVEPEVADSVAAAEPTVAGAEPGVSAEPASTADASAHDARLTALPPEPAEPTEPLADDAAFDGLARDDVLGPEEVAEPSPDAEDVPAEDIATGEVSEDESQAERAVSAAAGPAGAYDPEPDASVAWPRGTGAAAPVAPAPPEPGQPAAPVSLEDTDPGPIAQAPAAAAAGGPAMQPSGVYRAGEPASGESAPAEPGPRVPASPAATAPRIAAAAPPPGKARSDATVPPAAVGPRPEPGQAPLLADLPLRRPASFPAWLTTGGFALAILGLFLPWSTESIGAGSGDTYFDTWGLAPAGHWMVLVAVLVGLVLALVPTRVPIWIRDRVLAPITAGLLVGITLPYLLGGLDRQIGVIVLVSGAVFLAAGSILTELATRNVEPPPAV